jgi:hypothetical protein
LPKEEWTKPEDVRYTLHDPEPPLAHEEPPLSRAPENLMRQKDTADTNAQLHRTSFTSPPSSQSSRLRSPRGRTLRPWSSPSPRSRNRCSAEDILEVYQRPRRVSAESCKYPWDGGVAPCAGAHTRQGVSSSVPLPIQAYRNAQTCQRWCILVPYSTAGHL